MSGSAVDSSFANIVVNRRMSYLSNPTPLFYYPFTADKANYVLGTADIIHQQHFIMELLVVRGKRIVLDKCNECTVHMSEFQT